MNDIKIVHIESPRNNVAETSPSPLLPIDTRFSYVEATTQASDKFAYKRLGQIVGKGKHGPIELIMSKDGWTVRALKRISKQELAKSKKLIQHVLSEKSTLLMMKGSKWVVELCQTFTDSDDVCFVFEYLPAGTLFTLMTETRASLPEKWYIFYAGQLV